MVDPDGTGPSAAVQYRVQYSDKTCVQTCPTHEYLQAANNYLCGPCDPSCNTCADLAGQANECTSCTNPNYRLNPLASTASSGYAECVDCSTLSSGDGDQGYFAGDSDWC